ncbi:hypothetical protein H4684_003400 [Desulfomicrobium macestii]|uniref:HTH cro/C1-type domain-containing protein n=1 Tax=Desulfomicrobium macestii TaxID=90731 RepID=A0ABR9H7R0_9BACT|nr:helix-turn-helix domain-containing protein [Desulfomicrobium macestii]MBE1426732.1 hypothetical protein [Desulfomicrobium macestii]
MPASLDNSELSKEQAAVGLDSQGRASAENNDAASFEVILSRMLAVIGGERPADLAGVLGISQASVSGAKKRKNIPDNWFWAISDKYGVSVDWLRNGTGEIPEGVGFNVKTMPVKKVRNERVVQSQGRMSRTRSSSQSCSIETHGDETDLDIVELLGKVVEILKSESVYSVAMVHNIQAFHQSIRNDREIDRLRNKLDHNKHILEIQVDDIVNGFKVFQEENELFKKQKVENNKND